MCRRRVVFIFFFSSRRRHTRCSRDWISDVCSSDLTQLRCAAGERPTATVRRDVVAHSLFGVDLKLTAVRLAELRLWLALVADQDETDLARIAPLPNLDGHVRQGDALIDPLTLEIGRAHV